MFDNRNTLINNEKIKEIITNILKENNYEILNNTQYNSKKVKPHKYVLTRARYQSIYDHNTSSDFLIVNHEINLKLRVEVKTQRLSGSVDEKLPYFYLNALSSHTEDVLFIVEGDGFKRGAKLWLEEQIANKWLNTNDKQVYMKNLGGGINLLEKLI